MTFKKFVTILLLMTILPVYSKEVENNINYMNFNWWKNYNDEILIEHLQTLFQNNHDLKIAALKTKQAEENIRLVGANQLPQASFNGQIARVLRGAQTQFGEVTIPKYIQNEIFLPLSASYEIDIWGQNYLNRKSASKQKEIVTQQERAAYIYFTSSFVADYYNLIKFCELESIQNQIIELQSTIVKMTDKKYKSGLVSINELLNEKQTLTSFEKDLNQIQENRKVLNNEISVLLGQKSDAEIKHADLKTIIYPEAPEALSATIIQYRPDLISSENYAKKAGIDVRVAKRDFLPKFTLYGNLGFNAYKWEHIFASETFLSRVGIAPSWDIFSGGAKLARYRINKYEFKKAGEIYEKTVLTSIQEVNDALAEAKLTKDNLIKANEYFEIEHNKHKLSEKQFTVGDKSRLDTLKSEVDLYLVKKNNIAAKIDNVISTISLYNAVGGIDYTKPENL